MSWISIGNLRRFTDKLFHSTLTFDGSVTHNGADEFNGGVKVNTKPLEINGGVKVNTTKAEFNAPVSLNQTTTYKGSEIATKSDVSSGGSNITVDAALSDTSTNPVQNKVINAALNEKAGIYNVTVGYGALVIGAKNPGIDNSYLGFGAVLYDQGNADPVFVQDDYMAVLATEDYVKSAIAAIASYDDTAF